MWRLEKTEAVVYGFDGILIKSKNFKDHRLILAYGGDGGDIEDQAIDLTMDELKYLKKFMNELDI